MKLTLKQKREIVKRFMAGQSLVWATSHVSDSRAIEELAQIGADVIREYVNGKFGLKRATHDAALKGGGD